MPSEDIKAKLERRSRDDVRSFSRLKLDDVDVGLNMLRDLEQHPDGIENLLVTTFMSQERLLPKFAIRTHTPFCGILRWSDTFLLPKCTGKPLRPFWVRKGRSEPLSASPKPSAHPKQASFHRPKFPREFSGIPGGIFLNSSRNFLVFSLEYLNIRTEFIFNRRRI